MRAAAPGLLRYAGKIFPVRLNYIKERAAVEFSAALAPKTNLTLERTLFTRCPRDTGLRCRWEGEPFRTQVTKTPCEYGAAINALLSELRKRLRRKKKKDGIRVTEYANFFGTYFMTRRSRVQHKVECTFKQQPRGNV